MSNPVETYNANHHLLPIDRIRQLSNLNAAAGFGNILLEWLLIGVAITAFHLYLPWPFYFVLVPFIGARMMALATLQHDAAHWLLCKNKWLNDAAGFMFLTWPLFSSLSRYRAEHLTHHKQLKTDIDPEKPLSNYAEFQLPKSAGQLWWIMLLDLSGLNFLFYFTKKLFSRRAFVPDHTGIEYPPSKTREMAGLIYVSLIVGTLAYFNLWFEALLYWGIPYITWFALLFRMRLVSEHFNIPESAGFQTRSLSLNFFEKLFFYPHSLHYHVEHHLYPSVPCYRLPTLHKELMKQEGFVKNTHLTKGLGGLYKECKA